MTLGNATSRAVVTGGGGFIGSHVVDRLLGLGYEVLVVEDFSSGSRANVAQQASLEVMSIDDPALESLLTDWQAPVVVHCAAQVSVSASFRDPVRDARTNILGTIQTVRAAAAGHCRMFVYITTGGALYGEPEYLPCDESHPIKPASPYGHSKLAGERYLEVLAPDTMRRVILRLANVYGPRQRSDGEGGVVSILAERMRSNRPVEIHGDGRQTRDFVYVDDVVDAIVAAIAAGRSTTLNIATDQATSVMELYSRLAALAGYQLPPAFVAARHGDIRHSRLAISKAREVLGWSPNVTLDEGLAATYASIR